MELFEATQKQQLPPDVSTYNTAISACERGVRPERAFGLFNATQQRRPTPDVSSLSASLSACEKGVGQRALELLKAMQQRQLAPDIITSSASISACEEAVRPERRLWRFSGRCGSIGLTTQRSARARSA